MRSDEFAEKFSKQFGVIQQALEEAHREISEQELPKGIGPLRLSKEEIANIIVHNANIDEWKSLDDTRDTFFSESLQELSEELYLHQFPETLTEVMDEFHRTIVSILRHHPEMLGEFQPILKQLKEVKKATTRIRTSSECARLLDQTEDLLEKIEDDAPNYICRILDELADFCECMHLPMGTQIRELPTADNDNCPVTSGNLER